MKERLHPCHNTACFYQDQHVAFPQSLWPFFERYITAKSTCLAHYSFSLSKEQMNRWFDLPDVSPAVEREA